MNSHPLQPAGPYHLVSEPTFMMNDKRLERLEQKVESLCKGQEKMLMQLKETFRLIQVMEGTGSSSVSELCVPKKLEGEPNRKGSGEGRKLSTPSMVVRDVLDWTRKPPSISVEIIEQQRSEIKEDRCHSLGPLMKIKAVELFDWETKSISAFKTDISGGTMLEDTYHDLVNGLKKDVRWIGPNILAKPMKIAQTELNLFDPHQLSSTRLSHALRLKTTMMLSSTPRALAFVSQPIEEVEESSMATREQPRAPMACARSNTDQPGRCFLIVRRPLLMRLLEWPPSLPPRVKGAVSVEPWQALQVKDVQVTFMFILPELLAIALCILPWIRNFFENTNWKSILGVAFESELQRKSMNYSSKVNMKEDAEKSDLKEKKELAVKEIVEAKKKSSALISDAVISTGLLENKSDKGDEIMIDIGIGPVTKIEPNPSPNCAEWQQIWSKKEVSMAKTRL